MGRKLKGLHLILLLLSMTSSAVHADYRRMTIDPSPSSPTLGDLLDHERPAPVASKMRTANPPAPVASAPPVKLRRTPPPRAKSPVIVAVQQPQTIPDMPALQLHPLEALPAGKREGLASVPAKPPRAITTLTAKRHSLVPGPIMTGSTVPQGAEEGLPKVPPAEMTQPIPAILVRKTGKTAETAKAPDTVKAPEPMKTPESGRASDPPKISAAVAPATTADSGRFVYIVDQDLRSFLADFARRVGLRSEIAVTVRGQITKVRLPAEPTALLKEIEKRHEIEWIIDGETLKVSSRGELATRILPLGKISYEELLRELKQVGVDTARYPLQPIGGSNAVILTAPAAHVARIAALIEALKAGKTTGPEIRIIRSGMTSKVNWD